MRVRRRPTLESLAVILVVFVLQHAFVLTGGGGHFVLSAPLLDRPWTLATSVYAHLGLAHLVSNAVALLVVGPLVARRTTRLRFHAYFLTTGAITGVGEVIFSGLLGPSNAVLGASGAIFALLGYLLSGNVVSAVVLDRIALSARSQLLVFLAVAVLLTLATARTGTALFGHATGLTIGLLAGRIGLLDARDRSKPRQFVGQRSN